MYKLETKISKHAKDIIQKHASELFKDATLEFYGIKTAKIKELINVELPIVEVGESSTDFIFLLEDNTYLHFEFQTTYNKIDLFRFAMYDIRLYERDGRKIITVIIYVADVRETPTGLNIGSLVYDPSYVMMKDYNGDAIYKELESKIKVGYELTDTDMLNLIFLPLMKNTISRMDLAVIQVKLAQTITDRAKRDACIASVFAFANRYLNDGEIGKLMEVLKMTDLAVMFIEEAKREREVEIAKEMLKEHEAIDKIIRYVKLDENTILRLQDELNG